MCSTLFLLISKKQICTYSTLFCLSLAVVLPATLFCRTKTSNFLVTHYFYGEIVVCAYPIFCFLCSCSLLFSLPLIFTLLAASISHFLTAALNFHVFLPTKFVSFFSITRSSSFSVIHVSVKIKNNTEKDTTLLLFLLSKSPGGHVLDLFGWLNVVPNSNLPGIRFFVCCICIIMWHSHLNDMEIPETKRFIPKGFELGTTLG